MADAEQTREQEIKEIWKNHGLFFRLLRGGVLIGIGFLLGLLFFAEPQAREGYMVNVFTSMLGLGATALIFDELNRKRSQDDLKRQLIMDAGSQSNEKAKDAVHQMRKRGWLDGEKGLLIGADLSEANLHNASLTAVNLQGAYLANANLSETYLYGANFQFSYLSGANFQKAILFAGSLQRAKLHDVNFFQTDVRRANLRGAYLYGSNLQGANLNYVEFDSETILPDNTFWTPETDMARFTDPDHPAFWRSDDDLSPAYRGDPAE